LKSVFQKYQIYGIAGKSNIAHLCIVGTEHPNKNNNSLTLPFIYNSYYICFAQL